MSSAGQQILAGRIPGERIATTTLTADSVTFTTTETQIASVVAGLVSGRVYRVRWDVALENTVDGIVRIGVREDTSGGTSVQLRDYYTDNSGTAGSCAGEYQYTAVATADKTFVLTGDVLSGGGTCKINAAAAFPSYFYVEYVSG